jgi:hypothetical protein
LILREKPLFVIRKPPEEITEHELWAVFHQLAPREKQQFMCLRDNASRPFSSMTDALAENSFRISKSPPAHGMFLLHSRFNHSCIPNSKIPETSTETIQSFAIRDIVPGEEITFCYNTDFEYRTARDRHRELRFMCDCRACLIGTPFQQLSDMRRTLIRGLQYLMRGVDLDGQRHGSSPIIVDRNLKRVAEDLSIPISSRLIYQLLTMILVDDEGLLDDFRLERMKPGILPVSKWFRTDSNVTIARRAIAQETWLGKFCVASTLFGRGDEADADVAMALRLRHGLFMQR